MLSINFQFVARIGKKSEEGKNRSGFQCPRLSFFIFISNLISSSIMVEFIVGLLISCLHQNQAHDFGSSSCAFVLHFNLMARWIFNFFIIFWSFERNQTGNNAIDWCEITIEALYQHRPSANLHMHYCFLRRHCLFVVIVVCP
jgi:hypothetical protein